MMIESEGNIKCPALDYKVLSLSRWDQPCPAQITEVGLMLNSRWHVNYQQVLIFTDKTYVLFFHQFTTRVCHKQSEAFLLNAKDMLIPHYFYQSILHESTKSAWVDTIKTVSMTWQFWPQKWPFVRGILSQRGHYCKLVVIVGTKLNQLLNSLKNGDRTPWQLSDDIIPQIF